MQAENAAGLPEPEAFEPRAFFVELVVPTCATLALGEPPPHAEATNDSPATPESASARNGARFGCEPPSVVVCGLRGAIAISSPSQRTDLCLSPLYEMGGCITVTRTALPGGLRRPLGS